LLHHLDKHNHLGQDDRDSASHDARDRLADTIMIIVCIASIMILRVIMTLDHDLIFVINHLYHDRQWSQCIQP
jgi:hypothetical protein